MRYRIKASPMIVHCCHCRWCQRETGSGFVINAIVETSALDVTGQTVMVDTPSASGKGQKIARCPKCHVALWSHYPQAGSALAFVRAGTLDDPSAVTPDVHIFTSTKLPWVTLPQDAKIFAEFYDVPKVWPAEALARAQAAREV
ncbi:MAG TPA: GFA family protein [Rhizomicrobium sp.]|nr:GFA family protein [Rhizomicrobium sp.]